MNEENTRKLFEAFPDLYRGKDFGMKRNLMCFGFECDDGWYDLVFNLSKEILEHCASTGEEIPLVVQVKEKFGGLRFYIESGSEKIYDIIQKYEDLSEKTCEVTGLQGALHVKNGWMKTLCPEEAERSGYKKCGQ